jgi:hypothetical protein
MAENETRYFLCSDCGRTLREEELMTHIEYDQRLLERSWTPPVGEHSDWWYEKIAPLNLKEGEIVHVCRFCGEIKPVEGVPTVEGKSVADLRMVLNALDSPFDDASRTELELQKKDLELVLNDYFYSNYIIDQENVIERLNTTSGTFHIYADESIRFEDVMRRHGRYFRVPVYKWEKIANEYAEPTSLIEFFNEGDGWTVDVDTFAKYDYKKQYAPKMIRFQEIDGLLLKKRINRLEEEIAMLKKKLGD